MHTRRFGAFIAGMWLVGTILIWFCVTQSAENVERLFTNPPAQVQKEINDMGPDVARQIFRYQSSLFVRRVQETWEIIQLGLLGALLATSLLTAHRSRIVIVATLIMMGCVAYQAFSLTPLMAGLGRSFDFLPVTAALREREAFASFARWHRMLEILKITLALTIISRLLFDFYDLGSFVLPWSKAPRKRRRIRRRSGPGGTSTGVTKPKTGADQPATSATTDSGESAEVGEQP